MISVPGIGFQVFKKRVQQRCFLVNFAKFLRTRILKNICKRLLLKLENVSTLNGFFWKSEYFTNFLFPCIIKEWNELSLERRKSESYTIGIQKIFAKICNTDSE